MTSNAAERSPARTIAVLAASAVASVMPAFLVGALSVQVRDEFDVSTSIYGWAMASYFIGAALTSSPLGRVAQRIGPRGQLVGALVGSAALQLSIATVVRSFAAYIVVLGLCGIANAASQTAVNLAITEARLPRLGLAVALKQSGMPAGSMLAGLSVPVVALTLGWRWSYAAGAAIAVVAAIGASRVIAGSVSVHTRSAPTGGGSSRRALVGAAAAGAFLSFGAGTLTLWLVESGVDAGLDNGVAGLALSAGALLGIIIRMWWGFRLDRMSLHPFRIGGAMVYAGAAGAALLAIRSAPTHLIATAVAFGAGWIWPVFTNYGVMRANTDRSAAATGVTQTGVYIGILTAPLVTGVLIDRAGFGVMWLTVAASMTLGATIAVRIAHHF